MMSGPPSKFYGARDILPTTVTGATSSTSTWRWVACQGRRLRHLGGRTPDGSRKETVYLGQGKLVADCLAHHRDEDPITHHEPFGRVLRVTWAEVKGHGRRGLRPGLARPPDLGMPSGA